MHIYNTILKYMIDFMTQTTILLYNRLHIDTICWRLDYRLAWREKYPRGNELSLSYFLPVITGKQAYYRLIGSLCLKYHSDRCKGKEIMRHIPFSVLDALRL